MKRCYLNIGTEHEILDVRSFGNNLYVLDLDQKLIIFDFSFVESTQYLSYENVSIHENSFAKMKEEVNAKRIVRYLPHRTIQKSINSLIKKEYYEAESYSQIRFLKNMILAISQKVILFSETETISTDINLESYDHIELFFKNQICIILKLDFNLADFFELCFESCDYVFLTSTEGHIYYLSEDILTFIWTNRTNITSSNRYLEVMSTENNKILINLRLPRITALPLSKITGFFMDNQNVFFVQSKYKSYFKFGLKSLIELRNSILKTIARNENMDSGSIVYEEITFREDRHNIYEKIHSRFSKEIRRAFKYENFYMFISDKIDEHDCILEELISSLDDSESSKYIILTKAGKLLIFPLFVSAFESINSAEIHFIDTGVHPIEKIFITNGSAIITDQRSIHIIDLDKNEWTTKYVIKLNNNLKEIFHEFSEKDEEKISDKLELNWLETKSLQKTKFNLKGKLINVKKVNFYRSESEEDSVISKLRVLQYENRTIQIMILRDYYYLLEDYSHENVIVSALYDSVTNFMYLCFEDCIVEVFRVELESIRKILASKNLLQKSIGNLSEIKIGIQNAIKNFVEPLKTIKLTIDNFPILRPLIKDYYHTFNDFNNINWFAQSDIIKKSKYNDVILYHFKYFYNYFNMCYNDVQKYVQNTTSLVKNMDEVFKQTKPVNNEEKKNAPDDMFKMLGGTYPDELSVADFSKRNIFNLDLRNFHHFLTNLNSDRFQFLREKFNVLPIFFLYLNNKTELGHVIKEKTKQEIDPDKLFSNMFREFLKDSLENVVIEQRGNQVLYMKLQQLENDISGINYNTFSIFKNDSHWKVEFLSYFFQHFLYENPEPTLPLYNLARTFHLKIPFFENQLAIQGLGNSMSFFLPSLDSPEFYVDLLNTNDLLHTVVLTSITSFLLSYPHLSQQLSQSIAFELFNQFVIKRKSQINLFVLVLYFFNDNLLISASAHYLLNKLTADKDLYLNKLHISSHITKKILDIFNKQIVKITKPDDQLSKLELSLLMILIMSLNASEWQSKTSIKSTIFAFIELISVKNCITNSFFVISILKFLIKSIDKLLNKIPNSVLDLLIHQLHYLTLYYGLSLEKGSNDMTFMNSELLDPRLRNNSKLFTLLKEIQYQPTDIQSSIRRQCFKILKIIADKNINVLLSVFHKIIDEYEHFYITNINILDIVRYLVKFDDRKLANNLEAIVLLVLKSLDPHKPELRLKCQDFATKTLRSILNRYPYTTFNQKTQHFAVANNFNKIIIYDLKMALEWKILQGHTKTISAICIHEEGKLLASFSYEEERLLIFKIDYPGFFASILARSDRIEKEVSMKYYLQKYVSTLSESEMLKWDLKFLDYHHVILKEDTNKIKIMINL